MKKRILKISSLAFIGLLTIGCGSGGGVQTQSSNLPDTFPTTTPNSGNDTSENVYEPITSGTENTYFEPNQYEKLVIDNINNIRNNGTTDINGKVYDPLPNMKFNDKVNKILQEYANSVNHKNNEEVQNMVKIFGDDIDGDGVYDVDNNNSKAFKQILDKNGMKMTNAFITLVTYGEGSDINAWFDYDKDNSKYFIDGYNAICGVLPSFEIEEPSEYDGVIENKAMMVMCGEFYNK